MGRLGMYDRLLHFMYDEFERGNNASGYGQHIQVLISDFESTSPDNRLGNAHDQQGAVRYFIEHHLIEAVDVNGNRLSSPRRAYLYGRMQPTTEGRNHLREKRLAGWDTVASVFGTLLGKFTRSVLGR